MSVEYNEEGSMMDFMNELDKSMKRIHEGDIIDGTVLSVSDSGVLVNIGYMADGIITRENLTDDSTVSPKDLVKSGDQIKVYVLELNDGEGNVSLSKLLADSLGVWDDFEASLNSGSTLEVKVNEIVKGGAVASVKGVRAFIPASQLASRYVENMNEFLGRTLTVKVIELDRDKKKVVLSRKEVEKEENEAKKNLLWTSLKKGERRSGVVTRLAKFGAFVDIGGMDGLIHLSDLSWKRVNNPSEVVSVGDRVEVYILDFDKEKGRVSLGLKEVSENPWNTAASKYKVGSIVEGTVSRFMDFGAFIELEPGLDGLVHISEISEDRILKPSDVLNIGHKVKVKILEVNEKDKKIALSIKEAAVKPEEDFSEYNANASGVTIGDLLKDKFKNFKFE
jgi:small subunit ribosomal protein S1